MEENPQEAVKNNTLGTYILAMIVLNGWCRIKTLR